MLLIAVFNAPFGQKQEETRFCVMRREDNHKFCFSSEVAVSSYLN